MDAWEATNVVFQRVHALDPENATKIVGTLLVKDANETELIRLAFGPDHHLQSFVTRARAEIAAKLSSPPSPALGPFQAGRPWGMPSSGGEQMGCDTAVPAAGTWRSRPCVYFARGFCKNGSSCRFLHGLPENDAAAGERQMAFMQRAKGLAAPPPPLMHPTFPFSPSPLMHSTFPPQQSELQRSAPMLLGSGDMSTFPAMRSSGTMGYDHLMTNPAETHIYLTFPAESTFSDDDLLNYFSMYGSVEDVRIPHQQKRMFAFVTFTYPESVKLALSERNPHFVRGAPVLVKRYKEKGKVPERFRNPYSFNLQQLHIGPRTMLGGIATQETLTMRKLEEHQQQQQAGELQQAIELQGHRYMGLQLLGQTDGKGSVNGNGNAVHLKDVTIQDNKVISATAAEGRHEQQQQKEQDGDGTPKQAVNHGEEQKRESGRVAAAPNVVCEFQESVMDYNLPESPFSSSPVKAKACIDYTAATRAQNGNISPHHVAYSSLSFPSTSSLELPPYNPYFFLQVPRFTSGHEAFGL